MIKCGYIKSDKKCMVGLTDCADQYMLYRGVACESCGWNYPYIVDQLLGIKTRLYPEERMYYQEGMTFRSKAQRLMDEEQEKFDYHDAIEQQRCCRIDYDDVTPDDEFLDRIALEKSWGNYDCDSD